MYRKTKIRSQDVAIPGYEKQDLISGKSSNTVYVVYSLLRCFVLVPFFVLALCLTISTYKQERYAVHS